MKKAILLEDNLNGFRGHAAVYKMEPQHEGRDFVVASTASTFGVETYLFPSDESGDIIDWLEMEGSEQGVASHAHVFANIGYEIVSK